MSHTWNFEGEVVYVSAGAWGIGRAVVCLFAEAGARVVFGDIDDFHGRELVELLRESAGEVRFVRVDFADENAWPTMLAHGEWEPTVVVSNAGIAANVPIDTLEVERYDRVHAVNQRSALLAAKFSAPFMRKRGRGSIVYLGSIMSQTFFASSVAYVATKAALEGIAKSLAVELGPDGIRVNCVQPGFTQVGMSEEQRAFVPPGLWSAFADHFETFFQDHYAKMQPLRKGTDSADVANAVGFLCSDLAQCITGAVIPIDGGLSLPVASPVETRRFMTEWTPEMEAWVKARLAAETPSPNQDRDFAMA